MRFDEFCQLISDISHIPLRDIHEHSSFRDELGIDSLQMVHLITEISMKLKVGIGVLSGNDDFRTVGNLFKAFKRGDTSENTYT